MGMISFHELESVDVDDTSHGHEDPVFDVDQLKEILTTYAVRHVSLLICAWPCDIYPCVSVVDSSARPRIKPQVEW